MEYRSMKNREDIDDEDTQMVKHLLRDSHGFSRADLVRMARE
jgi:hypothetical protein